MAVSSQNQTNGGAVPLVGRAQLHILGPFRLTDAKGQSIEIAAKRNRALLALVAVAPDVRITRDAICSLLWGDRAEEQAKASLRQSLAQLRKELGLLATMLVAKVDTIQLNLDEIWADAIEFVEKSNRGGIEDLRIAADLYRGELLSDLALKQEGFDEWLSSARRVFSEYAINVLDNLASVGSPVDRVKYSKGLVELNGLREESHRLLIKALRDSGEVALAIRQFEDCKELFQRELGVGLTQATLELRQSLSTSFSPVVEVTALQDSHKNAALTASRLSVAVIPLKNLSGDPGQQILADGISEDLVNSLARFSSLAVISRSTSFRFRGDLDFQQVGQLLGAKYLVSGSIRRPPGRLRISVQLINAESGNHEWAENYDVSEAELFSVQDNVVSSIASTLFGRVNEAGVHHARLKPPSSLAAYELVLTANAINWESKESRLQVENLLNGALKLDANYALAHALLAAVKLRAAAYHAELTPKILEIAFGHAREAVQLEPNDSACHSIMGWVLIARGDSRLAEEHLLRALMLNPGNTFSMVNMGSLMVQVGEADQALKWFEKARETDKYFNPSWVQEKLALAHFTARRYELANYHFLRALQLRFYMCAIHAGVLATIGKAEEADRVLRLALSKRPDMSIETILKIVVYQKQEDIDHLVEVLSRTGLRRYQINL